MLELEKSDEKITYHREQEYGGNNGVDWNRNKVWELPRAIDEDVYVFGHNIDYLGSLLLLDLILTHATSELKDPTLDLRLHKPEVVVDMEVIVATGKYLH